MNVVLAYRGRYHVREALELEMLAAVLRQAGCAVRMAYDPDTFGVTDNVLQLPALARRLNRDDQLAAQIAAARPDAVVVSVLPATFAWARRLAADVKRRAGAPVIFVGLHPSLTPQRTLAEPAVDYVIAGEPEGVILPLLEAVRRGGGFASVGNLWFRGPDGPRFTFRAPLVDLDALPLPDKDLFAPYVTHRYSYSAMVSRGCPFRCSFCEETCWRQLHGPGYFRRKRVETVMRELAEGKRRYRFREVIFKDSYLSGDKRWLAQLMERYRREIRVPFKCFCTVKGFDDETARMLKRGGCYSVEFGLQTWNDRVRREVLHRPETSREALRAFACCDRAGLWYDVDHMFYLPTETREDHALGVERYARLRRLGRIKVHYLVYLPTAKIVEHGVAAGDLPPDAPQRLAEGWEHDFYDRRGLRREDGAETAGFAALYKILPLLPRGWALRLARGRALRWLARAPAPALAALQAANAVRCGDLRFLAYLHLYSAKVLHTLRRAARLRRRPEGRSA